MVTKEELRNTGKSFENTAYQVDFGNGYKTDTVVNNVPTVKPTKKNLNSPHQLLVRKKIVQLAKGQKQANQPLL